MSVFHHRAELLNSALPLLRYRFLPSCVSDDPEVGRFEVNVETWEAHIIEPAGSRFDDQAVQALVHQLKKQLVDDPSPPKTIHYVA